MRQTFTIRCEFVPQAWINDYACPVDPLGRTSWTMTVAKLPKPNSYESDWLRDSHRAPAWVRDWLGPFEVEYEAICPVCGGLFCPSAEQLNNEHAPNLCGFDVCSGSQPEV